MSVKVARTDHEVHRLIADRYSPYGFSDRPVGESELRSLFEAARWAASSFNEQPWRFLVARQDEPEAYSTLLSCLVEGNRGWAQAAPVLALGVVKTHFTHNDKPNRSAVHDLGLAAASLTFEATARGICLHQMAGIDRDRIREAYRLPDEYEPVTALAIGYAASPAELPDALRKRDEAPRERKPLGEFVYGGAWGEAADWLSGS